MDAYAALDSGGRVLSWNRAASKMFGWTREEAIGKLITDLLGVSSEQRQWVLDDMREYVATGQSPVVGTLSEFLMRRKSGAELPGEVAVSAVGSGSLLTFHVFIRDLTAASEVRAARRGSDDLYKSVFDDSPTGIAIVGLDGTFQRVNRALCRITRYDERELTQLTFQDITYPDDLDKDVHEATRLLRGEIASYQMEKRYYAKDGNLIWIHLSGSIARDADGQPLYFISHIKDISLRKREEEKLRLQATRDALTGVLNRARFEEELVRYKALGKRHGYEEAAAVLMIDLDGLKQVNDQGGHAAGDNYLKAVAQTIGRRLRLSDLFARIGGDEFAALLPHTSAAGARKLAQNLSELVPADSGGSVSIGIAMFTPEHPDDALKRADEAMYHAKQQGRGQVYGPV